MPNWLTKMLATGFYTGYAPVAGTVGTIPAWLIGWFLLGQNQWLLIGAAAIVTIASVYVATQAEHIFGHDAKSIVIDEWAGMWVTFIFLPHTLTAYIIAFFTFRVFDVLKLPPAAQAEKLPRGWGITADDVVAGIQANLATHVVLWAMTKL
ncbi:MAG: phosphatidylglycerophosphatase A [bacterium]|nr:phosphatidylglycerophosphatase A [bacterium]